MARACPVQIWLSVWNQPELAALDAAASAAFVSDL
jgi:hypothetical protein